MGRDVAELKSFLLECSSSKNVLQWTALLAQSEALTDEFLWHCSPELVQAFVLPQVCVRCLVQYRKTRSL